MEGHQINDENTMHEKMTLKSNVKPLLLVLTVFKDDDE